MAIQGRCGVVSGLDAHIWRVRGSTWWRDTAASLTSPRHGAASMGLASTLHPASDTYHQGALAFDGLDLVARVVCSSRQRWGMVEHGRGMDAQNARGPTAIFSNGDKKFRKSFSAGGEGYIKKACYYHLSILPGSHIS